MLYFSWTKNKFQQESPPAWTQEAYRPPRSKYTVCCSDGGGGYPLLGGLVPLPGGYLLRGVGTPQLDGVPPHQDLGRGYLPPGPGKGVIPLPSAGWGTPPVSWMGNPPPGPGKGTPLPISWMGYPPRRLDLARGTAPQVWTDRQTENITFPILRMWAVTMKYQTNVMSTELY